MGLFKELNPKFYTDPEKVKTKKAKKKPEKRKNSQVTFLHIRHKNVKSGKKIYIQCPLKNMKTYQKRRKR
jgi:hypothetical protein